MGMFIALRVLYTRLPEQSKADAAEITERMKPDVNH